MARKVVVYAQPGWFFCGKLKEVLSAWNVAFIERDVSSDPSALEELSRLGYMTTPVTTVDGEVVVGFDRDRLAALLGKS